MHDVEFRTSIKSAFRVTLFPTKKLSEMMPSPEEKKLPESFSELTVEPGIRNSRDLQNSLIDSIRSVM